MTLKTVKRKILKTGTYTYYITLPKEWVKRNGWRAKRNVELVQRKNHIEIR